MIRQSFVYQSRTLKVSGNALDLTISYRRAKSYLIFLIIAFFALKPLFIAFRSPDPYLRIIGALTLIVAIYAGLALALDRTTIRAVGNRFTLRHGPLPLLKGLRRSVDDIDLFKCEERQVRAAHYYKLEAKLRDGRLVKILSPVPDLVDAQHAFDALQCWQEDAREKRGDAGLR